MVRVTRTMERLLALQQGQQQLILEVRELRVSVQELIAEVRALTTAVRELVTVVKNHEGRIRALEAQET